VGIIGLDECLVSWIEHESLPSLLHVLPLLHFQLLQGVTVFFSRVLPLKGSLLLYLLGLVWPISVHSLINVASIQTSVGRFLSDFSGFLLFLFLFLLKVDAFMRLRIGK
jgi:hypothetical protein